MRQELEDVSMYNRTSNKRSNTDLAIGLAQALAAAWIVLDCARVWRGRRDPSMRVACPRGSRHSERSLQAGIDPQHQGGGQVPDGSPDVRLRYGV